MFTIGNETCQHTHTHTHTHSLSLYLSLHTHTTLCMIQVARHGRSDLSSKLLSTLDDLRDVALMTDKKSKKDTASNSIRFAFSLLLVRGLVFLLNTTFREGETVLQSLVILRRLLACSTTCFLISSFRSTACD